MRKSDDDTDTDADDDDDDVYERFLAKAERSTANYSLRWEMVQPNNA